MAKLEPLITFTVIDKSELDALRAERDRLKHDLKLAVDGNVRNMLRIFELLRELREQSISLGLSRQSWARAVNSRIRAEDAANEALELAHKLFVRHAPTLKIQEAVDDLHKVLSSTLGRPRGIRS